MINTDKIIGPMANILFEAEQRRLNGVMIKLNERNKVIRKFPYDGFSYDGEFHVPKDMALTVVVGFTAKITLDQSLWDEMEDYKRDCKQIITDLVQIRQTLYHLINPCTCDQDIRDTLPEFMVPLVPPFELPKLERTNDVGWTIIGNARAQRQFEKILPRMEFYNAVRLIY